MYTHNGVALATPTSTGHTHSSCIVYYYSETVVRFDCNHCMCVDCFTQYCIVNVDQRSFTEIRDIGYTIACPGEYKSRVFINNIVSHSLILVKNWHEYYSILLLCCCVFTWSSRKKRFSWPVFFHVLLLTTQ